MTWRLDLEEPLPVRTRRTGLDALLHPAEGWLTYSLLLLSLLAVAWSVEAAQWVERMPALSWGMILAILLGLAVAKLPLRAPLGLALGLCVGVVGVIWQTTAVTQGDGLAQRVADLRDRMIIWWDVVNTDGISRDPVPFSLLIVSLTWLVGLLSTWFVARWRNPWGGVVPGGVAILANLSYIPGRLHPFYVVYLFAALLLIMRLHRLRQERHWERLEVVYQRTGDLSFAFNASMLGALLLGVAWLVPPGEPTARLNDLWINVTEPWHGFERQFERMFAALIPTKAVQLHTFDRSFAFRGGLDLKRALRGGPGSALSSAPVMLIFADAPRYWRGRSYDIYGSQGWESSEEVPQPFYASPQTLSEDDYRFRERREQTIEVTSPTQTLFAAGQPISATIDVAAVLPKPASYPIDLRGGPAPSEWPPQVRALASELRQALAATPRLLTRDAITGFLPPDMELGEVTREGTRLQALQISRRAPVPPDVLGLRVKDRLQRGTRYTVASWVVRSPRDALQQAGSNYPGWVLDRYLQLPATLPARVADLARQVVSGADNAYDAVVAIEAHLRQYPFSLEIGPPPPGRDATDYFLFDVRQGYSDYYASAFVVMVRSLGVPARLATGYIGGDWDEGRQAYVVHERQGHAWPEVFFPGYGWVELEPTPSLPLIDRPLSEELLALLGGGSGGDEDDMEGLLDGDVDAGPAAFLISGLPWGSYLGTTVLIATLAAAGWFLGRYLWFRGLTGLELPQQIYVQVRRLASLSPVGSPRAPETPAEYGTRLVRAFPTEVQAVEAITEGYGRSVYGRKASGPEDREGLAQAWRRLRRRLVTSIWRRR